MDDQRTLKETSFETINPHTLSELLISSHLLTPEQWHNLENTQRSSGLDFFQSFIQKGFIPQEKLLCFFKDHLNIETCDLKNSEIQESVLRRVPFSLAQKLGVVPLKIEDGFLFIAISDPFQLSQIEQELRCAPLRLRPFIAPRRQIEETLKNLYKTKQLTSTNHVEIITLDEQKNTTQDRNHLEEMASSIGVVSTLNSILEMAHTLQASDIHLEPQKSFFRVRLRIDGCLEERQILPLQISMPLISRIKIISGMNIAEKRAPQDGRFSVKIKGETIDCRSSSYLTLHGEKIVIRLLSKGALKQLEELGLVASDVALLRNCLLKPHGLILVTGPTGSGKSTTLYAALQILNSIERNIVSIEDPVENEIAGVNQAQVHPKANITFASALRSMLRQDPDIIMVGEIRDAETAEMVLRAALTGHLVLSTLHTNNAIGAITRLLNLGIPPFLLSSSLIAVLAQRLARKICRQCRTPTDLTRQESELLKLEKTIPTFRGKGCESCRHTGYQSRIGLFELFVTDTHLRKIIERGGSEEELLNQMKQMQYKSMAQDAQDKIADGITTADEVLRVTMEL